MKPSEAFSTFGPTDLVLIVGTGCVGYLAREAFKHFFPGKPTVIEQLKVLAELVEACGRNKAKSLKIRISTDAKIRWEMPKPIQEAKVLSEHHDTIDMEIVFA
jgi:threonine dehydrogenase-like Zn-dependent dehydrogenase